MPAQKKSLIHIQNESIEGRSLFVDGQDLDVFVGFLKDYLTPPPDPEQTKKTFSVNGRSFTGVPHQPKNYCDKIKLMAYNLMPDHFHLVIEESHKGSAEKFMRSLSTRYVIYYNKRYQRRGSLFIGPYKSAQVDSLEDLLQLTRYLHHESLASSNHDVSPKLSSYQDYLGLRYTPWLEKDNILRAFNKAKIDNLAGITGYKKFVEKYKPTDQEKDSIRNIILEDELQAPAKTPAQLEANPTPNLPKDHVVTPTSQNTGRTISPHVFATVSSVIFVLLFSVGYSSVVQSANQDAVSATLYPSPAPQVAGSESSSPTVSTPLSPTPSISAPSSNELSATSSASTLPSEDRKQVEALLINEIGKTSKPLTFVVIKTPTAGAGVTILKQPGEYSEYVDTAWDGEAYEYVSQKAGWYQIKLDDGTGYVSTASAEMKTVTNKP